MAKVSIKVIPKSRVQSIKVDGSVIKVCLKSLPVEGRDNQELIEILAKKLSLPKLAIKITNGFQGKNKVVDILGKSAEEIRNLLK